MLFDDIKETVAGLMNTSPEVAGFILGLTVIIVLIVAISWLIGDTVKGPIGMFIPAGIAFSFIVLVGWWPLWTAILIGFILTFVIVGPFAERLSPGGGI